LKETAIDFTLENRDEVYAKKLSFNGALGALVRDVLAALGRKEKKEGPSGLHVNELRWRAHAN
jgi:hypothetical protein